LEKVYKNLKFINQKALIARSAVKAFIYIFCPKFKSQMRIIFLPNLVDENIHILIDM